MDFSKSSSKDGVFELLTKLCQKTAEKYCVRSRVSQKYLAAKLRSQSYEIILKRSSSEIPSGSDPFIDLLAYHFVSKQTAKNVAEYKKSVELKKLISTARCTDFGERKELVNQVLRILTGLKNSVQQDLSNDMFQHPFTFGLLDEMLPKPNKEIFGSPEPYSYFPSYVFELPYSMKHQEEFIDRHTSKYYTEVPVESFNSRSFLPNKESQHCTELKTFLSPMSLASMASTAFSPYSDSLLHNFPRLMVPRDLQIPSCQSTNTNVKVSLVNTSVKSDTNEVVRKDNTVNIWELASQLDKNVPEDIWEIVAKMPPVNERQLIAASTREAALWRRIYANETSDLNVISEKQFIRHIMYLIIGVETSSFPFNQEVNRFYIRENIILEGISKELLMGYCAPLLLVGTYYRRLYNFAFNLTENYFHSKGLVFEAAREAIRKYLLEFRLIATVIYEECCNNTTEELNLMPTLLQILYHTEPLEYEIETVASIYKMVDVDSTSIPHGAELMSYLFNEISLVTHRRSAEILYNSLFSTCSIYFKIIERFIFEGELDDINDEFFIRKDNVYVNSRSKRYWDKGFHITLSVAIPDFLRPLASFILLCGKSLRLLKLCNPSDPLVLLISSDHPSVRCCASFDELEHLQQVLDVYRTRCLFVSGEPVTFEQILLKREAERKAFTEMASLKQAETMEKIVAERKRLAQLIIAEKQHSLRVLEAAMAEAKASKNKLKKRETKLCELEQAAHKATEEVDSKLKSDERNKIMEYYSKLNMEVEKSKIHTEWKIKRLQLDQSRMQLLSTEERNLKREKLELEHQRNESIMAMSIQSDFKSEDDLDNIDNNNGDVENPNPKKTDSTPSVEAIQDSECLSVPEVNAFKQPVLYTCKQKDLLSNDIFNTICNVAKSIFGVAKPSETPYDNSVVIDAQGNIVTNTTENNPTVKQMQTSNDVIGGMLENAFDNLQYLEMTQEALKNKQKGMRHEFGQMDRENNQIRNPLTKLPSVDEENNIEEECSPYVEAKRNRLKVLGTEFLLVKEKVTEPRTEAQREALVNKQKVLGVEYNLPIEKVAFKEPVNVAQEEALRNKNKVLGVEYNLPIEKVALKEPVNVAQEEALRNKNKVLGVEYNLPIEKVALKEPVNVAQEEALRNKNKVLGVEYNLPIEKVALKEPVNVAQEEALVNKNKVLGVEYNVPIEKVALKEPVNVAQEEALRNKNKVLGVEYNLPIEKVALKEPVNVAQEEALVNKNKVLGVEYNLPIEKVALKEPVNVAQEEALMNKNKVLEVEYNLPIEKVALKEPVNVAQEEALRNKNKFLGVDYNLPIEKVALKEPVNVAQKEALRNKNKFLGLDYNLPIEKVALQEPVNVAQEEALKNKNKVLGAEYQISLGTTKKFDSARKSGLRLNLKPFSETMICPKSLTANPNAGVITPGELFPRLDLETPTTAEMPLDGGMTSDIFTPRSEGSKDIESAEVKPDKDFLSANGFNFSIIVDDETGSEIINDVQTEISMENSTSKGVDFSDTQIYNKRTAIFSIIDGSYSLESFDPFGVKHLQNYSKDYFNKRINNESDSFYTHPAIIFEEVKKKPYDNIFASRCDEEKDRNTSSDNIATLTACLQRSVMLPLTYQLEVVNNSVLSHFLVNLDMYEHLRSLKDYFFLMDGEFSRSICHNLFIKLTKTINPQEMLNFATLHNILDKALGSSISHVHKFSENLSFTITESPLSFQHSSPDVLQCLSLTYSVGWPLNIILSQEALLRYAKVFQFLIKMRRIFWVLSQDFEALKLTAKLSNYDSRKLLESPQYISIQIYRHMMASLIRALDNYIVTTCILMSWTEFEKGLKKARTLDDLYECHVVYIKNVLFRCLLNNRSTPVMKLLNDIFTVILKFSRVLKAGEWQQKDPKSFFTHTSFIQLEELFHLFEKLAKYLHKVVTKLTECGYQRHLVELLTMVNLNGYYDPEKSKEETNVSLQST